MPMRLFWPPFSRPWLKASGLLAMVAALAAFTRLGYVGGGVILIAAGMLFAIALVGLLADEREWRLVWGVLVAEGRLLLGGLLLILTHAGGEWRTDALGADAARCLRPAAARGKAGEVRVSTNRVAWRQAGSAVSLALLCPPLGAVGGFFLGPSLLPNTRLSDLIVDWLEKLLYPEVYPNVTVALDWHLFGSRFGLLIGLVVGLLGALWVLGLVSITTRQSRDDA